MTVSVLVPTYNRPELLKLALASLDGQMKHELIVWEGDKGQSYALNQALAASTGRFVMVLQDDDTILPGGIEALHYALSHAPSQVGAVYSLPQYTDEHGVWLDPPRPPRLETYLSDHPMVTWETVQESGLFIHGTATMYWREALEDVGWDESLHTAEEYDMHLRMLHAGWAFKAADRVTVTYRKHPGGKSQNRKWRRFIRLGVMEKIYQKVGL